MQQMTDKAQENVDPRARAEEGPRTDQAGSEAVDELRLLVLDPYGRNAELICQTLTAAGLRSLTVPSMVALVRRLEAGAGAVVLSQQTLEDNATGHLQEALAAQPAWSDLPLIVLTGAEGSHASLERIVEKLGRRANVVTLTKPLWPSSLVTAVRAALRARRRQYELRALYETLEQRVAERTETVQRLAADLTRAEQEERQRISQILHDELQQMLYSLHIQVQMLISGSAAHSGMAADLGEIKTMLGEAMTLARTLTVELSPPELQTKDMSIALSLLAEYIAESHHLHVDVEVEKGCLVDNETVRLLVLQGVRELLFNAVKHAGVQRAVLRLWRENGRCAIEVQDEGAGFDLETIGAQKHGTGFGLPRVAERMALLGGKMVVETAPGEGTRVRLLLPKDAGAYPDQR